MEKCIITMPLETINDVKFAISNTILSYNKKKQFTVSDIVKELKEECNFGKEVFEKWPIKKEIENALEALMENGKVIECARWYELVKK